MRTLVLIGHPDLAHSGTQAFLQAAAGALTDADEWDISAQGVPDSAEILRLQGEMRRYDRLIFQFPLYWYSMPGVFKQWLDTVWTTPFVSGRP
ncbi:NAD(P)H-dependent oxidoreductase, partial [Schleiferilactobacillus harbinensis]